MTEISAEKARDFFFSLIHKEDLPFEEECQKNPFTLRVWLRYLAHKQNAPASGLYFLYERALKQLPMSYKLWKGYLDLRLKPLLQVLDPPKGIKPKYSDPCKRLVSMTHPDWDALNDCFERALVYCYKYPVIWIMYGRALMYQGKITACRRVLDRALRALPVTQHPKIWQLYLFFAQTVGGETCVRLWKRYLKLEYDLEGFVDACLSIEPPRYLEAAKTLAAIIETPNFASKKQRSLNDFWTKLCEILVDHAEELEEEEAYTSMIFECKHNPSNVINRFNVERILRYGIKRFPEQAGLLWNALAKWFVLKGEFEKARDIYEEAIKSVNTVKDFSIVFDAYSQFEESILSTFMAQTESEEMDVDDSIDIDFRIAKLELLLESRPFLVNDVILRQNPHNVAEWENRAKLFKDRNNKEMVIQTYENAIKTIIPKKASGKYSDLFVSYAKWHEENGDLEASRAVFERAKDIPFKKVDELAEIWCQYAEMELRHDGFDEALTVVGRATAPPSGKFKTAGTISYLDESLSPQVRLFKSLKLWSFYVDLTESIGTVDATKAVYDRILELKIANPQIVINYANFLEDKKFFEESYKVYERGIDLFGYPIAFDMWNLYLNKFVDRYKGTKLERARDLFEQALDKCPPKYAKTLFLMYAKLEEEYGIARHAMKIYARATEKVEMSELLDVYLVYISKATSFFGIVSTREIYQKALEQLPDRDAREIAYKFIEMEIKLGEVDRARAVYGYTSQFSDPNREEAFWKKWHAFEVQYGNEDTFKEMLSDLRYISAGLDKNPHTAASMNPMQALEAQVEPSSEINTKVAGFVRAKTTEKKPSINPLEQSEHKEETVKNPDEIAIESDDEEEELKTNVPDAVFGGLKKKVEEEEEQGLGAKDRFKRRKVNANE